MKKIRVYVSTNRVGSKSETVIEVEDDTPESEIDGIARDAMFELIEWSWEEVA